MAKGCIYDQNIGFIMHRVYTKNYACPKSNMDTNEKEKMCNEMLKNIIIMFVLFKCVTI
jgi:hypothetical protein